MKKDERFIENADGEKVCYYSETSYKTAIFIRTYAGDLEWLKYCLRSINKFCKGFSEIIITIPENQKHLIDSWNLTAEKVIAVKGYDKDYLGQQITKLNAWRYTDADLILYVDSDCCFHTEVTPETFMQEGKPIILKTHYSLVGDAICWQSITEKFIGFKPEYEYMRRLPLMYWSDTIKRVWQVLDLDNNAEEKIMQQPGHSFSEFNLLGYYADKYEKSNYLFIDTEDFIPEKVLVQNHSWSGFKTGIKQELEELLK